MNSRKKLNKVRASRAKRVRMAIKGNTARPRLSIFRSNRYTYAQLIDDSTKKTLVAASSRGLKIAKGGKTAGAEQLGKVIAEKSLKAGIDKAVVDRGSYQYHGRVKAVVAGAREGGLKI